MAVADLDLLMPQRLTAADIRRASVSLGRREIRYLVDYYYMAQDNRKAANNQVAALTKSGEPHQAIRWLCDVEGSVEKQIKSLLDKWTENEPSGVARWSRANVGIGPVITAGLMSLIEIVDEDGNPGKSHSASAFTRFLGVDPTVKWEKGQLRPWSAFGKVLVFKVGESFVKTCNHPNSFYGPVYSQRKELEIARNEQGLFAEQAREKLATVKIGKDTEAYKAYAQGKLPPAHIHARARRYAAKLFLHHFWEVAWRAAYPGQEPPKPWIIAHGGHIDYIPPPNPDLIPGVS